MIRRKRQKNNTMQKAKDKSTKAQITAKAEAVRTKHHDKVTSVEVFNKKGDMPNRVKVVLDNEIGTTVGVYCYEGWEEKLEQQIQRFKNKKVAS